VGGEWRVRRVAHADVVASDSLVDVIDLFSPMPVLPDVDAADTVVDVCKVGTVRVDECRLQGSRTTAWGQLLRDAEVDGDIDVAASGIGCLGSYTMLARGVEEPPQVGSSLL